MTFCRCITHISSIIDINWFALLTTGACYDLFYPSTDNSKNHKGGISNVKFEYNLFKIVLYWCLDLIRHNNGTPIPFCHNLYLSATFKQFLKEFAGFEIIFQVVHMWTPHVRSDWSNWPIKSHVEIWYALRCKQHGRWFRNLQILLRIA